MLAILATLSAHSARRVFELGALLGLLGGVAVALRDVPSLRRYSLIVAGILLIVCFVLLIYAVHFGQSL